MTPPPVVLTAETAKVYFDISESEFAKMLTVGDVSLGTTKVSASSLFTSVKDQTGAEHTVSWALTCSPLSGYHAAKTGDGLVLQLLNKHTFKVEAKTGEEGFDKLFAEDGPLYKLAFGSTQEGMGEWPPAASRTRRTNTVGRSLDRRSRATPERTR